MGIYPKKTTMRFGRVSRQRWWAWLVALSFMALVGGLVYEGRLHVAVFGLYAVMSVYAFLIYARDKSAARNDRFRISEKHLHLAALAGGWPGAMTARASLRHKSSKRSFGIVFWLTVLVNTGILIWTLSPQGGRYITAWMETLSFLVKPFS
jgi:uncharacterized membrane protein YsdA (DUF1294 family)